MTKILIDRAVMEQALEALELAYDYTGQDTESGRELCREARVAAKALRAALAEPEQEPFGYLWPTGRHPEFRFTQQKRDGVDGMPLYTTAPPQRKPLTDEEIYTAYITATNQTLRAQDERLAFAFARAIEAKLKEKNT